MVSWDVVIKSQNDKAEGRSEAPQEDSHGGLPKRDSSEVSGAGMKLEWVAKLTGE